MRRRILILGGYGVFGGRLAAQLATQPGYDVIVAGRSLEKANTFCAASGGRPLLMDRTAADFEAQLADEAPFLVVDAAGPFQAYHDTPYRVARAAIDCGAHYIDFSDDAAFTQGIGVLDADARRRTVTVLSGVSSVPALSSAAVDALTDGLSDIHLIETAILPGNRAPRGTSVMRAILSQVGRDIRLFRGRRWTSVTGWSRRIRLNVTVPGKAPLRRRRASFIGAPDLTLFPQRYQARSVLFRAGLDLGVMHDGLGVLSVLVRSGLVPSLLPFTAPLKWAADRLEPFGSDRGGMCVRVLGRDHAGQARARTFSLIAEAGDGPQIPAVPAQILCDALAAGTVPQGARPALGEFDLVTATRALSRFAITTALRDEPFPLLFQQATGDDFARLPPVLQDLHIVMDVRYWQGRATVARGPGVLSRLIGAFMGFPPAASDVPVTVTMTRKEQSETWERCFGARRFRSHISPAGAPGSGAVVERFGLVRMELGLTVRSGELHFPVRRGSLAGVPLPRFLLPQSNTREFVDSEGRAWFDVDISMPIAGHIVSYKGWLRPDDQDASTEDQVPPQRAGRDKAAIMRER